jgi:DNA-binding GntR family transcriptional regulator
MPNQKRRRRPDTSPEQSPVEDLSLNSVEQATGMIRQAILSGKYGPGERLKVAELSSQFGFSPMPLREALRKLEGEGLIEIEPNRGATVRQLDRHFVEDLFEINTELRVFALRRGMRMMTLEKIDALVAMATAFEEAVARDDLETGLTLNREFHARIVEIGGNSEALRIFLRGWELIGAFRRRFGYGAGRQSGLAREKRMLIEAIRRQDLQFAEAIIRMQHAAATEDMLHRFHEEER